MRYEGLFATINNAASPGSPLSGTYSQRAGRATNLFSSAAVSAVIVSVVLS